MKDLFNLSLIDVTAQQLKRQYAEFDVELFTHIAADDLQNRELKDRANQIYLALVETLPTDFEQASQILINSLQPVADNQEIGGIESDETGLAGWIILPFSQYIGQQAGEQIEQAMTALYEMTKRFSSEFGIRYLLISHQQQVLNILQSWLVDPCHHVRRLISEGTRSLLPWAMQLPAIKTQPQTIMHLLEALKDDESEYVRRSVANNLNDIAKHHPDLVAETATNWLQDANKNRQRLVKHACRTLIKQGHKQTLMAFGYGDANELSTSLTIDKTNMVMGDALLVTAKVTNTAAQSTKVLLDYVVYHQKANGSLTPKVFKWKEFALKPGESVKLVKKHVIKPITTRKYYSGEHKVALQLNGVETENVSFELVIN